jgi:hypothetical protein
VSLYKGISTPIKLVKCLDTMEVDLRIERRKRERLRMTKATMDGFCLISEHKSDCVRDFRDAKYTSGYCATNRKVVGSIPDGVMEFFIDINSSDRTMTLGSTQPLTDMSNRSISWGLNSAGV